MGKFTGSFMKVVSLNKNVLAPLAIMASGSVIDGAIREKILERRVATGRKGVTLVISNVITIIKSLENLGVLIHGVSKTLKYEIKKIRRWISWYVIRNFNCFNVRKYVH